MEMLYHTYVGNMAQCLGCRSLAGRLPDLCPIYIDMTGDHFVGKLSTVGQPTRPTEPSIPLELVNE